MIGLNWKHYLIEFLTVFIGVSMAFLLGTWNDSRRDKIAEEGTLKELAEGLKRDTQDIHENMMGHRIGVRACDAFTGWANGDTISADSLGGLYHSLLRDYVSVQNKTSYEVLKTKGLELMTDDSLRTKIVQLYDYHFEILEKLEEEYEAMQFYERYASNVDQILLQYLQLDSLGMIQELRPALGINEADRKQLLLILARVKGNRTMTLTMYQTALDQIDSIEAHL